MPHLHPNEPTENHAPGVAMHAAGSSESSWASTLAFPADMRPQRRGGTKPNRQFAYRVPYGNTNAFREESPAGDGMQALGRTRAHGKNDNPGESRAGWGRTGVRKFFKFAPRDFDVIVRS